MWSWASRWFIKSQIEVLLNNGLIALVYTSVFDLNSGVFVSSPFTLHFNAQCVIFFLFVFQRLEWT